MNLDARQLLRRLEPAVRPAGVGVAGTGRAPLDRAGFDDLLARAAGGEFASGRPVDQGSLDEPLDESFRERLAHVADAAETAGFETVLVVVEDRPLILEVGDRRLAAELGPVDGDALRPVDAAVRLVADEAGRRTDQQDTRRNTAVGPTAATVPPAIAEAILAGRSIDSESRHHPQDARGDAA